MTVESRNLRQLEVEQRIASVASAMIAGRGLDLVSVANALGLSRAGLYKKLNGPGPWRAWEVAALSELLEVPLLVFYGGLDALWGKPPLDVQQPRRGEVTGGVGVAPVGIDPTTFHFSGGRSPI